MLVYLDNSHFDTLARARVGDPSAYERFMEVWKTSECELALTGNHFYEIRRYRNASERASRYKLLYDLGMLRTDFAGDRSRFPFFGSLQEREVLLAFIQIGMVSLSSSQPQHYDIGFPGILRAIEGTAMLEQLEDPYFEQAFDAFRTALDLAASADEASPRESRVSGRVSDLSNKPISAEQQAELEKMLKTTLNEARNLVFSSGFSPEVASRAMLELEPMKEFFHAMIQKGPRTAMLEQFSVSDEEAQQSNLSIDFLIHQSMVRDAAGSLALQLGIVSDRDDVRSLAELIPLELCAGSWLAYAVEHQMKLAKPVISSSDRIDLGHVSYLPYVDLMMLDKRITEYARQALNRSDLPGRLEGVNPARSVPARTDTMTELIASSTCLY